MAKRDTTSNEDKANKKDIERNDTEVIADRASCVADF
jgi:hypothetical protein